jgi:serine protease AprX
VAGVEDFWTAATTWGAQAPAIAFVDSGLEGSRDDFGGRVVQEVTLTALVPNAAGDGRGHGSFVASIAAGEAAGYAGAAPNAPLVSIDVLDDHGMALTSDVISAADWILRNKETHGIRVVNFSLHGSEPTSFMFDPLDKAVEKLWFSGIVVVTAAGNYAVDGQASGVLFSPGNDPFVITVGASDIVGSVPVADDFAAPWSSWGYTPDGFAKPELVAPGRYMVGAVPSSSTIALERPERIVEPGYMQLSGTSFSTPVVAGAAAYLLALNPQWTPDDVKGALMQAALPLPAAEPLSFGMGEVNAGLAAQVADPPNPNLTLNRFLIPDPTGDRAPIFNADAWKAAALADAHWGSDTWDAAHWGSANWGAAHWGSQSWDAAHWGSASWGSGSGEAAHWGSSHWGSNAEDDVLAAGGYWLTSPAP